MKTRRTLCLTAFAAVMACSGAALARTPGARSAAAPGTSINSNVPQLSPRKAALNWAKSYFGAGAQVASRPLLNTRTVNPLTAYRIRLNGQRTEKAVMVRGGFAGYSATGVADVHLVKPNNKNQLLGVTGESAVILKVRGKNTAITAQKNLSLVGEGSTKTTRAAAFRPVWPSSAAPGTVQPMIYPGPASSVVGEATVRSGNRQSTVKKAFTRMVIMGQGNPQ